MSRFLNAVGAISILTAVPAVAQDMQPAAPTPEQSQPATAAPAPSATADTTPTPADVTPAPTAAAPVQSRADQVSAVLNTEFPAYDKDKDGDLSKAEFSSWMTALKQKTEPTADAAATTKWVDDAFVAADKDKSTKVSKAEMNSFLMG